MTVACLSAYGAGFTNGGFETGDWSGWTRGGGTWDETPSNSGTVFYHPTGDPGKSGMVTPGGDPNTNSNLNRVLQGNYAFRVNNEDNDYHYSTLSQTVSAWSNNTIYFAWAAVLEEPSNIHSNVGAPKFSIMLTDTTTSSVLYDYSFNVYNPPMGVTWTKGAVSINGGDWYYSPWVNAQLDTTAFVGHDFQLDVSAYDCGWGGHGGYAYVDYFGGDPPPPPQDIPEPGTMLLMGLGLAAIVVRRKRAQA